MTIKAPVPLVLVRETGALMVIAFLHGGSAVSGSLVSSYVGIISPENKRGRWVSIPQSLSLLAAFAAPFLGGYLYTLSPYYAFVTSISVMPILAIFALLKLKE
jgi:MFS family permease